MITRILAAGLLLALSITGATARVAGYSPECNVTMPCDIPVVTHRRVAGGRVAMRPVAVETHRRAALARVAPPQAQGYIGGGLVERARSFIGRTGPSLGLPARLWCADFMNMLTGGGTGSRLAKSYLSRPQVSAQVGAIVVTGRRGGGHVAVVSGFTADGDVIAVSGNNGHQVRESVIPRSRVLAFVSP